MKSKAERPPIPIECQCHTVGKDTKKIKQYIANQLKEDQEGEQLAPDLKDPFKSK